MKKKELYQKTVDILVQAYFNDTLEHSDCTACAVGNIVAANIETCTIPYSSKLPWRGEWSNVFCTSGCEQDIDPSEYRGNAKLVIDATGYKWQELAKIEKAFESVRYNEDEDKWMFDGLMAVIDALDEIHENKDASITTTSKNRFQIAKV